MLPAPPLVSVVIPVYNGELYLAEAIESALAQREVPVQVLVSDDGSTDGSAQVAARYCPPARCLGGPNGGPAQALNRGVAEAEGELLAFLDADDVWAPEKLAWQVKALQEHPECQMIFGHVRHFFSPEVPPERRERLHCPPLPMPGYVVGTLLIARKDFLRVGLFDPRWRAGEFIDWYARATDLGLKSWLLPEVVASRRVHGENLTVRAERLPQTYASVLKATLDRRRRTEPIKAAPPARSAPDPGSGTV